MNAYEEQCCHCENLKSIDFEKKTIDCKIKLVFPIEFLMKVKHCRTQEKHINYAFINEIIK